MSDRDVLALTIAHPKRSPTGMVTDPMPDECDRCADALRIADAVLAAGFRRTVTPEQIEAAAEQIWDFSSFRWDHPAIEEDDREYWRDKACRAARAFGLSVDGAEQPEHEPWCECGEPVARWGQSCPACSPDPEDAHEAALGYVPDSVDGAE